MSRLVVQHPHLAVRAINRFADLLGRPPDLERATLAVWNTISIDRRRVEALADEMCVDAQCVCGSDRLDDFRLITFDMDSTLITIECVDEIADFIGRKAEVAAITEAAMRGEIADYDESLRRRVALLEGLDERVLERVFDERLTLSPGAESLIESAKSAGLKILLVSGGFTFFTERLREQLGLDAVRSNRLEIIDGHLTGRLLGEIVNARVKRRTVEETCRFIGCSPSQAIVVGDGANDLLMMQIAGVSIAYHAKPVVRAQTTHAINYCGLDAILNLFLP